MFLPLMMSAQNVLTPQQQLEQAQKQLEEAKKAVEAAKIEAEKAKVEADKAKNSSELKPSIANEPAVLPAIGGKPVVVGNPDETSSQGQKNKANGENANGGWEVPTTPVAEKKVEKVEKKLSNGAKLKADPKYLEGAVTTNADGKVEFVTNIDTKGKSAQQVYDIVYKYFSELTQEKNNISSRVALVNATDHVIANTMDEWLVFSSSFISLDRAEFKYQLVAKVTDNNLQLTLSRILYNYEEGRATGFKEPAENVIVDKYALNKKKNDLAKIFGKFRRETINRKDQIFNDIKALVEQQ